MFLYTTYKFHMFHIRANRNYSYRTDCTILVKNLAQNAPAWGITPVHQETGAELLCGQGNHSRFSQGAGPPGSRVS